MRATLAIGQLAGPRTVAPPAPCWVGGTERVAPARPTLLLVCFVGQRGSWAVGIAFLSPSGVGLFIHRL